MASLYLGYNGEAISGAGKTSGTPFLPFLPAVGTNVTCIATCSHGGNWAGFYKWYVHLPCIYILSLLYACIRSSIAKVFRKCYVVYLHVSFEDRLVYEGKKGKKYEKHQRAIETRCIRNVKENERPIARLVNETMHASGENI